jgi:hypothetical protein
MFIPARVHWVRFAVFSLPGLNLRYFRPFTVSRFLRKMRRYQAAAGVCDPEHAAEAGAQCVATARRVGCTLRPSGRTGRRRQEVMRLVIDDSPAFPSFAPVNMTDHNRASVSLYSSFF